MFQLNNKHILILVDKLHRCVVVVESVFNNLDSVNGL